MVLSYRDTQLVLLISKLYTQDPYDGTKETAIFFFTLLNIFTLNIFTLSIFTLNIFRIPNNK